MLTKLTITVPDLGDNKKNLDVEGALAAGEKATVTLVGIPSGTTTDGTELRLRVLGPMGEDLATHGDWTVGTDGEYTTDLDLATLQAYRLFVPPPPPPPPPRMRPVGYPPVRPAVFPGMKVRLLVELREDGSDSDDDRSMLGIAERPLVYWPTNWKTATLIDLANGRVYSKEEVDALIAQEAQARAQGDAASTRIAEQAAENAAAALRGVAVQETWNSRQDVRLSAIEAKTNNWNKKADLVGGKVPSDQLPSYVDDVVEYASLSAFPATGEAGKIYVALDTNKTYRWSGSAYVMVGGGDPPVPIAPSTDPSAAGKPADAKATGDALALKQDTISDLATIRSGAAAGATAVQPAALSAYRTASAQDAIDNTQTERIGLVEHGVQSALNGVDALDRAVQTIGGMIPSTASSSNKLATADDLSGKQDTITDLATIRSGAASGATAVQPSGLANYVQKSQTAGLLKNDGTVDTNQYLTQHQDISGKLDAAQRNMLAYESGGSTEIALSAQTAVYRGVLGTDGTFPYIEDSGIPTAAAYYQFELEMIVPSTVPSTITGPSGWTFLDGHGLPDPADLSGGETIYVSVRMDCTARTFLASVWRVA